MENSQKNSATSFTHHGVGRRKSAVARVWLKRGKGAVEVNGKDYQDYFDTDTARTSLVKALKAVGFERKFDIMVNVSGGGMMGQAEAACLGIARAILASDETVRKTLRQADLLTVDSRIKERKKYGQKAARRKFQFVKR